MSVTLRSYQAKDMSSLKVLFIELQAYEKNLLADRANGESIFDDYWQELCQKIKEKKGDVVVAEEDSEIVGFISYFFEKDILNECEHLYVSDLIVNEEYRSKGIATQLMTYAENLAKKSNIDTVRVGVLANSSSKLFYQKQGYELEAHELKKKI